MIRNICLIGLPTAGKTTIGKKLFQHLNMGFIDTDELIKQKYNSELPDLISKYGRERFLDIEMETITSLKHTNVVLATGGSVIYREKSMDHLKSVLKNDMYHLFISKNEFKKRMKQSPLRGIISDPGQSLDDLYNERLRLYDDQCDYIINVNQTVNLNLNLFKTYEYWKQSTPPFIMYMNKHKFGNSSYPCPPL